MSGTSVPGGRQRPISPTGAWPAAYAPNQNQVHCWLAANARYRWNNWYSPAFFFSTPGRFTMHADDPRCRRCGGRIVPCDATTLDDVVKQIEPRCEVCHTRPDRQSAMERLAEFLADYADR